MFGLIAALNKKNIIVKREAWMSDKQYYLCL